MAFCDHCRSDVKPEDSDAGSTCPHCGKLLPPEPDEGLTVQAADEQTLLFDGGDDSGGLTDISIDTDSSVEVRTIAGPGDDATVAFDTSPIPPEDDSGAASSIDVTPPYGYEVTVDSDGPPLDSDGGGSSPEAATIDHASSEFDSDSASPDRRGRTPSPRHLSGISSRDGDSGDDRGSQSIKPGDFFSMGTENVRLRSHSLGERAGGLVNTPSLEETIDYRFVKGPFAGGMGEVWKAEQATLNRDVAVKRIKGDKGENDRDRDKFISEAVITGQLEHPNIIPVHDLGIAGDGLPFYSMKFVEGTEWEDQIDALSEEENLSVLIQVAQAIAFAHSKNIIHMDLKPANVMLGGFGEVLVMDWGLAARLDSGREVQPGGTPMYMPPELALPFVERWAKLKDPADTEAEERRAARRAPPGKYSDIYLLGALLFRVVAGCPPHRGKNSMEVLKGAARNKIVSVNRRGELLDIAYRAMATDPLDRYAEVTDFIDAVRAYQAHAQSVQIAKNASRELRDAETLRAEQADNIKEAYESYARARHGYENALDLWPGNDKARRRLTKTRRLYAEAAYANGDYDLALSMLEESSEGDAELRAEVLASRQRRRSREAWYKTLQYATAASLVAALIFIGISFYYGNLAHQQIRVADRATQRAEAATEAAETAGRRATEAEGRAENAAAAAADAERLADEKVAEANRAEALASEASAEAEAAQAVAREKTDEARLAGEQADRQREIADSQRREAQEQRYFAAVGEVRATLADDGAYAAWKTLQKVADELPDGAERRLEWRRLRRLCDWRREAEELLPVVGESRPALTAASPDGAWFVVVSNGVADAKIALYKVDDDAPQRRLTIDRRADAVTLSADARYAATLGGGLAVWDLQSGRALPLRDESGARLARIDRAALAFHPRDNRLIVGGADTGLESWRIDDGAVVRESADRRWHRVAVTSVGFSPDGVWRFSADRDGVLRVWSDAGDAVGPWSYRHDRVASGSPQITAAVMSRDGGRLAYGCADGAVYEIVGSWEEQASRGAGSRREGVRWAEVRPERLPGAHLAGVASVGYAVDDAAIVSAGGDAALVRRSPGGPVVGDSPWKRERRLHDQSLTGVAVGAGGKAVSGDASGRVVRWRIDAEPDELVLGPARGETAAPVAAVRMDPESGATVVADRGGFVRRWIDPRLAAERSTYFAGHADHRDFRAWSFDSSGPRLVTVAADDRACVWDAESGALLRTIDLEDRDVVAVTDAGWLVAATERVTPGPGAVAIPLAGGAPRPLWRSGPRVACVEPLDPSATRVAVGLRDGQVYLWSASTGRVDLAPSAVRPHWRPIRSMAYDAERRALLVGDYNGVVSRWRVEETAGELNWSRPLSDAAPVTKLAWAADGRVMAVQRWSGAATVSLLTGEDQQNLSRSEAGLTDATLVADVVVAIGAAGRLSSWDEGENCWEPTRGFLWNGADPAGLTGVSGRRDGRLVAFGGGVARVWLRPDSATTVRSRPPARVLADSTQGDVASVDASGRRTSFAVTGGSLWQDRLPLDGVIVASANVGRPGEAVLAVRRGDATDIEVWDLAAGRSLASIARQASGEVVDIDVTPSHAAYAVVGKAGSVAHVVDLTGERVAPAIDLGDQPVRGVALRPDGREAVAVYEDGSATRARLNGGRWTVARLDRAGIAAAAYSPDGGRLIVGADTGQVFALGLGDEQADGTLRTRRLLTMVDHSDAVTLVDFATRDGESVLVSGDTRGHVVVRSL